MTKETVEKVSRAARSWVPEEVEYRWYGIMLDRASEKLGVKPKGTIVLDILMDLQKL